MRIIDQNDILTFFWIHSYIGGFVGTHIQCIYYLVPYTDLSGLSVLTVAVVAYI